MKVSEFLKKFEGVDKNADINILAQIESVLLVRMDLGKSEVQGFPSLEDPEKNEYALCIDVISLETL